jgi:hypothetical protein
VKGCDEQEAKKLKGTVQKVIKPILPIKRGAEVDAVIEAHLKRPL